MQSQGFQNLNIALLLQASAAIQLRDRISWEFSWEVIQKEKLKFISQHMVSANTSAIFTHMIFCLLCLGYRTPSAEWKSSDLLKGAHSFGVEFQTNVN